MKARADLLQIVEAYTGQPLSQVRDLFREYTGSLEIDLCFQGFEQELAELPGRYALPEGRLLLAIDGSDPVGCAGLRKISEGICEMKRLYVKPDYRLAGLGRLLAQSTITAAREAGYREMRLDTLATMASAIRLYQTLGFQRIAPYYDNPNGSAIFMSLNL